MKLDQYQYQLEKEIEQSVDELSNADNITVEMLIQRTAEFFEIRVSDISCRWRFPAYVQARQFLAYVLSKDLRFNMSTVKIGKLFNRDHSSIVYALHQLERYYPIYEDVKKKFDEYKEYVYRKE